MKRTTAPPGRGRRILRVLLGTDALMGASAALGMALVLAPIYLFFGVAPVSYATVGVIGVLIPDSVAPRRGKFRYLILSPMLGLPLFLAVQWLRMRGLDPGWLLIPGTFVVFLITAWGRKAIPLASAIMLTMLFAMAPQAAGSSTEVVQRLGWALLGTAAYTLYAIIANVVLNPRVRTVLVAQLLLDVGALMRIQARRLNASLDGTSTDPMRGATGELLRHHAALATQIQTVRDVVLEAPHSPRRQQLAGMLVILLEMHDNLLASALDLERTEPRHAHALRPFVHVFEELAGAMEQLADAKLMARPLPRLPEFQGQLAWLREDVCTQARAAARNRVLQEQASLARSYSYRLARVDRAMHRLLESAHGNQLPDLSTVRNGWTLFVSPVRWSTRPLLGLWRWDQPVLRHATRATLAIACGYLLAGLLPWVARDYWILLTIVVVLRGNLAQTLSRRNDRVMGTILGSLLATALIVVPLPMPLLLLVLVAAQGVAHASVVRNYVVAAVASSVLGLILIHLLYSGNAPTFAMLERIGDTLLGAGIAWGFSYLLPDWEKNQIRQRVERVRRALERHARHSLNLATLGTPEPRPELDWRLARREAYDALAALVQATQRALVEPRAVRPPLLALENLQMHSYQLLGQLSVIQSTLLLRRDSLIPGIVLPAVADALEQIDTAMQIGVPASGSPTPASIPNLRELSSIPEQLLDPGDTGTTERLLYRLDLAVTTAHAVGVARLHVLARLQGEPPPPPFRAMAILQSRRRAGSARARHPAALPGR